MMVLKLPVKISLVFFPEVFAVLVETAVAEAEVEAAAAVEELVAVVVGKGYVLSWLKTFRYQRFFVRQPLQVARNLLSRQTVLLNLIPFHLVPPPTT